MKKCVVIALIAVFAASCAWSQTQPTKKSKQKKKLFLEDSVRNRISYGIFADFGPNVHSSNFGNLPGCPNCSPSFSGGSSMGFTSGFVISAPMELFAKTDFSRNISFSLFAGYNQNNADFSTTEKTNVILDGTSVEGAFEHTLKTQLSYVFIAPTVSYNVWDKLFANFGFGIGFNTRARFYQIEKIIEPNGRAVFADAGKNYRNEIQADIPDASKMEFSLRGGLSFELPLNRKETFTIVPEAYYSFALTSVTAGSNWHAHNFRIGASLRYKQPPPAPPPPPPPMPADQPEVIFEQHYSSEIFASLRVVQLDSMENETKQFNLKIEDFITHNLRPLLTYVFFEENSSEIPSRYVQYRPGEMGKFTSSTLQKMSMMETYYQVLNIIGSRLRENPGEITLVGTNSGTGEEDGNKSLSRARAQAVKDYLVNTWRIPDEDIRIVARNLPDQPSNGDEPGGDAENRRVEIITEDYSINEPVQSDDTLRRISTSKIRFYPSANSKFGIDYWRITASQSGETLKQFEGRGMLPEHLDWTIKENDPSSPQKGGEIFYSLFVRDSLEQSFQTKKSRLPVEQLTISKKRKSGMADKEFETYSLILFDFGKSKLENEHKRVVDFVRNRITDGSTVTITGYTDAIGEEAINKKISTARANAVAQRLKLGNARVEGVGEDKLIYDNTLPEGRFYCRTVQIEIETPVVE